MNDLTKIGFEIHTPSSDVKDYVQAIWFAENPVNSQSLTFKIMSDAGSTVAMNFGDGLSFKRRNDFIKAKHGCITSGPSTDPLYISFKGKINSIGINFHPEYAHMFFGKNMVDLSNKLIKTTSDHFSMIDQLYSKLLASTVYGQNRSSIVAIIELYILEALKCSKYTPNKILVHAMNDLTADYNTSLTDLSANAHISMREMQRIFKKFGGVSPKKFMRLSRVRDMKDKISRNELTTLSDLAVIGGYFDQAHFTREFRHFFDDTPDSYYKLKINKR